VFWQSRAMDDAQRKVAAFDRESLVLPLIAATGLQAPGTLASAGDRSQQLTRVLRDALHAVLHRLQYGQVLLATVGSISPFVGLLGTVWGIYHALVGIAAAGQITIDKVSGPVGEALIMTAAGLAVAIPAVLAYNIFGRNISRIEADLEGFAYDLRELLLADKLGSAARETTSFGGSDVRAATSVGAS
jgi:biopolymer transport protein ExbB